MELKPANRDPLPLSFAVMTVIVTSVPWQVAVVVLAAEFVAYSVHPEVRGIGARSLRIAERAAEAFAAGAVYQVVHALSFSNDRAIDLAALTAAAIVPIIVADLVVYVRDRRIAPLEARSADLAIVTSGILMAVGYKGIAGDGRLGLWVRSCLPFAHRRLVLVRAARFDPQELEQTVQALAAARSWWPRPGRSRGSSGGSCRCHGSIPRPLDVRPRAAAYRFAVAPSRCVCLDEPDEGFVSIPWRSRRRAPTCCGRPRCSRRPETSCRRAAAHRPPVPRSLPGGAPRDDPEGCERV